MTYFAVGLSGRIYHRSNDGIWTNHSVETNGHFYGIHGVSDNEVYAVGYATGFPLTTLWYKWDGVSWNVWTDAPSIPEGYVPGCIYCLASNDIYLGIWASTYEGYVIHWNGSTWTKIIDGEVDPLFCPYVIWGPSSTEIYCAGITNWFPPMLKRWNGSTSSDSTTIIEGYPLAHLHGSNGTIFTTGAYNYGIYRGTWDSFNLDDVGTIIFSDGGSQLGWNNLVSSNGKAWAFGTSPIDDSPAVTVYDGSSWSVTYLKPSWPWYQYHAVGGSTNPIAVYGGYSVNGGTVYGAIAFVWNGTSWVEESLAEGEIYFLPTDAWDSGSDSDPPELVDQDPAPNSRIQVSNSLIAFSVVDASDIETSTIDAYVNDAVAFTSETFLSPFDGSSTSFSTTSFGGLNGYRIVLDYTGGDWDSYQLITVRVVAKDSFLNLMDTTYSFRAYDTEGVEFTNIIPTPSSTRVDKNTIIQVDIFDRGSGVNSTSIDAYVEGIHAYIGNTGSFVYPYNGSLSALTPVVVTIDGYNFDGYRITIDKQGLFQSGTQINVIIDGLDREGN